MDKKSLSYGELQLATRRYKMKSLLRWLGLTIVYLIGIGISLVSSINIFSGSSSLDTRKIDRNIERLRELDWFNELHNCERHRISFLINSKIRKYLQSSFRVQRLKTSKREQKKFIETLEKVAEAREKNNSYNRI